MFQRLLACLKILIAVFIVSGFAVAIGTEYKTLRNELVVFVIAMVIVLALVGSYLFYLIKTANWNWEKQPYRISTIPLIGLAMHLFFSVYLIFLVTEDTSIKTDGWAVVGITLLFFFTFLAVGIYDSIRFYAALKQLRNERSARQQEEPAPVAEPGEPQVPPENS